MRINLLALSRETLPVLSHSSIIILEIIMLPVVTATAMTRASFVEQHFPRFDRRLHRCAISKASSLNFLNVFSRRFYGSPRAESDRAALETRREREIYENKRFEKLDMSHSEKILIRLETRR